jgi:hypothetical protein
MQDRQGNYERRWWEVMLRDPQWWVPLIVLAGGLMVLHWIQ